MECGGKRSATPLLLRTGKERLEVQSCSNAKRRRRCALPAQSKNPAAKAHGLRRRKNWAGPVSGSCTLRSVVVMVGVFVTVVHDTVGSEVAASRM